NDTRSQSSGREDAPGTPQCWSKPALIASRRGSQPLEPLPARGHNRGDISGPIAMSETVISVSDEWKKRARINPATHEKLYRRSIEDPNGFWGEEGRKLQWIKPFTQIKDTSFDLHNFHIRWFADGTLNVSANCIDCHIMTRGNQVAIIWEDVDPKASRRITYAELHREVCRFANVLKRNGVKRGDRVTIYLPMIPEAAYAMLACARIGAIHSVVFAGFSPDSLAGRILDCGSDLVITADEGLRGGRPIPLKRNTDIALTQCPAVKRAIVVRRTGENVDMNPSRDLWYHDAARVVTTECPCEPMHAEDPLFILYTSGSTGQPKGVLHTTGGYLVFAAMTHQYVFDYHDGDIYWCTA